MWENTDQKNSEYEHFLRSGIFLKESNFNDRNDSQKAIVQKWSVEGSGKYFDGVIFSKDEGLDPQIIQKLLYHRYFCVTFTKFFRTAIL